MNDLKQKVVRIKKQKSGRGSELPSASSATRPSVPSVKLTNYQS